MLKEYEYVTVRSTRGHFNFCDPSQESVSTLIVVHTAPDKKPKYSCTITTDDEIEDPDIEALISEISSEIKRYCVDTGRERKINFLQYLRNNKDFLYLGNLRHEFEELLTKKERIGKRMDQITREISGFGHFDKGRWVE